MTAQEFRCVVCRLPALQCCPFCRPARALCARCYAAHDRYGSCDIQMVADATPAADPPPADANCETQGAG